VLRIHATTLAVAALAAAGASGCVSGRVLSGYPGYPFASFSVPGLPDSTFFRMQYVLEDESYPIDYTDREAGLVNTRPGPDTGKPVFLSVVIAADPADDSRSQVWIAGFQQTGTGVKRVNPLDEPLWSVVMDVSARVSERFGGTEPLGPDERAAMEGEPPPPAAGPP
jgi:hypothetical protein